MTAPHSHAAAPTETAEVAHDGPGAVDSRGLPFTDGLAWAPGRHSFTPEPDVAPAPQATGLIHIAGNYLAAPGAKTAPCHVCGEQRPVVLTLAEPPYAICPAADNITCLDRGAKERAAVTELLQVPAPEPEKPAAAPEAKPAAKTTTTPRKRPVRPSKAREAVLDEAPAETAEAAPEGAPEGGAA